MKLLVNGILDRDGMRGIIGALLQLDIGARINFHLEAGVVRVEGRLGLDEAVAAIEGQGFRVASVVDDTVVDTVFRPAGDPRGDRAVRAVRGIAARTAKAA